MNQAFKNGINKSLFFVENEAYQFWLEKVKEALALWQYIVEDENNDAVGEMAKQTINALCWISRTPEPNINYTTPKSFFIFGTPGAGKTFFLEIIANRFNCIKMIDVDKIEEETIKPFGFKDWRWIAQFDDCHLVIDDIGSETDKQVIMTIVKRREKLWKNNGILTFYTSNLKNREELESHYGTRIKSRLLGQCNFIKLTGKDRRS